MIGPVVRSAVPRQPERTVDAGSPPCTPMPGMSSGSVGAISRTRAISAG